MKHSLLPAILLEAIFVSVAFAPDFRPRLLVYFALVATAAVLALLFAKRASRRTALVCGLVFRATLWFRPPDLSDDLVRFVWDGRVAASGLSPYAHPPNDFRLASLRDSRWQKISHREALTVYPPAAEILFKLGAASGAPEAFLKAIFGAADLAVVWLLGRFAGPSGAFAAALYASFPLAVVEGAGMGHVDSVGIALLLSALLLLRTGRNGFAGLAAALSVLVKYVSGAAVLPWIRRGKARFVAPFLLCGGALWWSAAGAGASPAAGMPNFATRWEGNSILYPAVLKGVSALRLAERAKSRYADWKSRRPEKPWMQRVWPYFYSELFARAILAALLVIGLIAVAAAIADPVRATGASVALLLFASPVLHPWYLLWVLPFAALAGSAALLYLSAAAPLGYALLYPTPFFSAPVVLILEYVPFSVLLFRELP